ncbi:hypothetical protein C8J57DRAFT_1557456 [Mycena rebaudengoi]|nr:hypothetical protein C8J57DRAFT_1557456 [Mycena rebaudengoi]
MRDKRRSQRAQTRDERRQKFADALNMAPSKDRTAPLFTDAAPDLVHKSKTDLGRDFFQSESAETYLGQPGGRSYVLRLGSAISNHLTALSRCKVDHDVADGIRMSLKTGILPNPNNELPHRMARSIQRHSSAMRKANESREAADISAELRLQIEA